MLRQGFALVIAMALFGGATSGQDDTRVQFNRDVQPIFADKCFACHGPDKNKREAELFLGDEASAKAKVIVAGKPDESELLSRITSDDPDERMPPGSTGKALTDAEIESLRKWIEQGAEWQEHWSLIAPKKAGPPDAPQELVANEIDSFIVAMLQKRGLAPSDVADRRTLIRRLSFDLTGLPPTPQEVDEFIADESPDAYAKVVQRLLGSKHFGERMAMYWLDVVRYADSGGYHSDNHRDVAPYRDFVIDAFNRNLPFNEFTIAQLAGDLLPDATAAQKIASGYNRLLQTTQEGGAQPKEYTAKYLADRVRNTATAWLGVTLGCAECHNHKFDPFTTKDFYSFGAFFADVQEKAVGQQDQTALPTREQEEQLAAMDKQLVPLRDDFNRSTPEFAAALAKWSAAKREALVAGKLDWKALKPEAVESSGGQRLQVQDDSSVLASGENPDKDTYTIRLRSGSETVTGVRLEALLHDSLTNKSLSRANGNFVLTEVEMELTSPDSDQPTRLKIKEAIADFSQKDFPVANAIDGKPGTGWAVDGHNRRENRKALFVLAEPAKLAKESILVVRLRHESQFAKHNIGRLRIAVTSAEKPQLTDQAGLSDAVASALKLEPEKRNDAHKTAIDKHYRETAPELADLRKQIKDLEKGQQDLRSAFPKTLVSVSVTPRMVRILPRGNWLDDSGEVVQPATPATLPGVEIKDRQKARLELGRWMAAPDNPLTARVFVNRLWKLFFGQGIVKSLDDFGTQGQLPTHPELLDWMAGEFVDSGWDVKHMIELMVMSRTYQQSSLVTAEMRELDPGNRWLARQARFRLDAEMVRDSALAMSGLLSKKIGGPSVKPYQPAGYWQHLNFPKRKWQHDKGDSLYRRGLYTYWQRTFLHPSLLAFDAPSREECTVERPRSNTPLQALVLLNDPTYVEAARKLAARMIKEGGDEQAGRLEFAFRVVLNRAPNEREREVLLGLYDKHSAEYSGDEDAARQITQAGESPTVDDIAAAELAAWTSVARVLLNLHETITRY
jgi:mono/diheme cytochrome c family protein